MVLRDRLRGRAAQRLPFVVVISGSEHAVEITVRDGSDGTPVATPAQKHDIGGRGLAIVEQVARDWGVTVAGETKAVWARFDIH
jgi:hypothetical protein